MPLPFVEGKEPDYKALAWSLSVHEAAFMYAVLQEVKARRVLPLTEALMHRVLDSPIKSGIKDRMIKEFYKEARARK